MKVRFRPEADIDLKENTRRQAGALSTESRLPAEMTQLTAAWRLGLFTMLVGTGLIKSTISRLGHAGCRLPTDLSRD